MRVQRYKGTEDLTPARMEQFRFIEGIFRDCCLKWGYEEVRTPTLEYLYLFTSTGTLTPGRLRRVYSFLDWDGWSGERVVLRPDGTIPIARVYIDNMADKQMARLFYVTNVFTFEESGKEKREKWQCGAELIGAGSTTADAELVVLALEVLKKVGISDLELKLSHAGLIKALLVKLGLSPQEQVRVFDQILDGTIDALPQAKQASPNLKKILASLVDMRGKSSGFLKNIKVLFNHDLPELEVPFNNFIEIVEALDSLGCRYQIDITSGRGFEYYTGAMFQLYAGDERVGGGGRYDALIPQMGGKQTPASGFALYLDPLMAMVKPAFVKRASKGRILIKAGGGKALKQAFELIDLLHEAGYDAEMYFAGAATDAAGWLIEVRDKRPPFLLTIGRTRVEAQTAKQALDIIKHHTPVD